MRDTVRCFREHPEDATGFYIRQFSRDALLEALSAAVRVYRDDPTNRMKRQYETLLIELERNPGIGFEQLDQAIRRACPI